MADTDLFDIFMKNNKSLFDCTESENNMTNIHKEVTELLLLSLKKNSTESLLSDNKIQQQNQKKKTFPPLKIIKSFPVETSDIPSNDFAYITVIPIDHETNSIVSETVLVWCQNLRSIHIDRTNYDIVALFPTSPSKQQSYSEQYKCFDKLMSVDESIYNFFSNYQASKMDSLVISKLWMFSLVQYKRVIFMKYSIGPVRNNIYNYFFKDYYLNDGTDKSIITPKKLYTQSSELSPINADFMSLEPSIETAVDLLSLYALGKWDVNIGWMCYGPFDFDPDSRMESFEDPNESFKQYLVNRKKEVHPWQESTWSFDASWSDTGLLFYYHYLKHPETSGLINEWDFDQSVIEFVSIIY
jgi:hypothetical protein